MKLKPLPRKRPLAKKALRRALLAEADLDILSAGLVAPSEIRGQILSGHLRHYKQILAARPTTSPRPAERFVLALRPRALDAALRLADEHVGALRRSWEAGNMDARVPDLDGAGREVALRQIEEVEGAQRGRGEGSVA